MRISEIIAEDYEATPQPTQRPNSTFSQLPAGMASPTQTAATHPSTVFGGRPMQPAPSSAPAAAKPPIQNNAATSDALNAAVNYNPYGAGNYGAEKPFTPGTFGGRNNTIPPEQATAMARGQGTPAPNRTIPPEQAMAMARGGGTNTA